MVSNAWVTMFPCRRVYVGNSTKTTKMLWNSYGVSIYESYLLFHYCIFICLYASFTLRSSVGPAKFVGTTYTSITGYNSSYASLSFSGNGFLHGFPATNISLSTATDTSEFTYSGNMNYVDTTLGLAITAKVVGTGCTSQVQEVSAYLTITFYNLNTHLT